MATAYTCDQCQVTASNLTGWHVIDLSFHTIVDTPVPGTRAMIAGSQSHHFHDVACRDAWLAAAKAEIPPPLDLTPPAGQS